jgi:hypothetical protein
MRMRLADLSLPMLYSDYHENTPANCNFVNSCTHTLEAPNLGIPLVFVLQPYKFSGVLTPHPARMLPSCGSRHSFEDPQMSGCLELHARNQRLSKAADPPEFLFSSMQGTASASTTCTCRITSILQRQLSALKFILRTVEMLIRLDAQNSCAR